MAENWLDCPVLGPGWKRRESFRKSGATCGRSDTYYQSPTGERIRSKVELTRFLGPDCDLSCFDFKRGVLQYLPTKASSQKKKRQAWPRKAAASLNEKQSSEPRLTLPAPQGPLAIWCENCGANISGDSARRQRLRSLCKSCRAQRNAFNREQRMFKRVGCGDCAACRVTEDCGICTACVAQLPQPSVSQPPRSQCAQRRCLKIINKSFSCGLCSGCQTKEDCGACRICERKGKPGLKRQWKCLQRRCLKKQIMQRPRGLAARKLPGRWHRGLAPAPPAQAVSPSGTAKGANRAQLQYCRKQEESLGKGEEEKEAAKANTPVIMEIYSLSGATPTAAGPCGGLDSVLQEFLAELNELPLPAHWEVLPPRGPDLCIIQRSPLSTVAEAVIHIQPGLYFHVVVQDVPVPPSHELYSAHPLRLTTVDEVVELICDLEAYHLCPGRPGNWQQDPRSPDCAVLVYEGCCQACCLEPSPSGSSRS